MSKKLKLEKLKNRQFDVQYKKIYKLKARIEDHLIFFYDNDFQNYFSKSLGSLHNKLIVFLEYKKLDYKDSFILVDVVMIDGKTYNMRYSSCLRSKVYVNLYRVD